MKTSPVPVPFHGTSLFLVEQNDEPYTPMKPIVEGMGLDWRSQQRKLTSIKGRWGMVIMTIPSQSGEQETLCMPLRKLPGWLMTIQPTRVKPEIREKILRYQNECDDVLWEYWTKGRAANPRMEPSPETKGTLPDGDLERERLRLEAMRIRIDRAMKLKRMILDFRERDIFGLAEARRAALSAVEILVEEEASGTFRTAVPTCEDPVLFAAMRRAVCDGLLASVPILPGDSALDSLLLGRGIPPTSRNLSICARISRVVLDIHHEIRDRILEDELRDPPFRETLEKAVRQFLEGEKE